MADEERKKRGAPWAAIVVILLVAYPLSVGPAIMVYDRTPDEQLRVCIAKAYAPVEWTAKDNSLCRKALRGYARLWR